MKNGRLRLSSLSIWVITGILAVLTVLLIFYYISFSTRLGAQEENTEYERYYAMITDDSDSSFWQSVYKSALASAKEQNAYVEMMSENLSKDYDIYDLTEIAIASGVDGIIIAADESEEMTRLINKANDAGISVVTVYSDNSNSDRLSFVGISNYNLGKLYGGLIINLSAEKSFSKDKIRVVVLTDAYAVDTGQNVLFGAIQETIETEPGSSKAMHPPIEVSMYSVDSTNEFSVEESVRNLLVKGREDLPDIVVCLNEIDTTSTYQEVVDYNEVGLVNILGDYDSETILKGIDRNVIYATVSVDTDQMGQFSIDALSEYFEYGYTSQYFTTDITLINKRNVTEYMEDREEDEE
ncbi:MAG: substrate-binding domain-containing protein [Lachnospiraceae bacterium]|nr:substrate-binding domain-containing protein [Lachnospiraceae bacterium]